MRRRIIAVAAAVVPFLVVVVVARVRSLMVSSKSCSYPVGRVVDVIEALASRSSLYY